MTHTSAARAGGVNLTKSLAVAWAASDADGVWNSARAIATRTTLPVGRTGRDERARKWAVVLRLWSFRNTAMDRFWIRRCRRIFACSFLS